MRFSALTVSFLAVATSAYAGSFVARQDSPYPTCSLPCLASAPLGKCGSRNEVECLCKDSTFVSTVTTCFTTSCTNVTELATAINVSKQACLVAGVTLTSVPANVPSTIVSGLSATPTSTGASKSGATKTSRDTVLALGAAAALALLCL